CQRGNRDACSQSFEVDREIDAGQRFVKIVDVEKNVFFWCREGSEVHQMAVAAGLDGNACGRLMPEVFRHHRGGAAQEGEWVCKHSLIANRSGTRVRSPRVKMATGSRSGGPSSSACFWRGVFRRRPTPRS